MKNLFFNPNGQIGSALFIRAGYILILIGAALGFIRVIFPSLSPVMGTLSLLLGYPWMIIWAKRIRISRRPSPALFLYIGLYLMILFFSFTLVIFMFGGPEFMELINAKLANEISQTEYLNRAQNLVPIIALPALISGLLSSLLTLHIGDKTMPKA